jgi:hypothetical protein
MPRFERAHLIRSFAVATASFVAMSLASPMLTAASSTGAAPFSLHVATDAASVTVNAKLVLHLTVTNVSESPITFAPYRSLLALYIYDSQGKRAPRNVPTTTEDTFAAVDFSHRSEGTLLQPGAVYSFPPLTTQDLGFRIARPGSYKLFVSRDYAIAASSGSSSSSPRFGTVSSNVIQISVQ